MTIMTMTMHILKHQLLRLRPGLPQWSDASRGEIAALLCLDCNHPPWDQGIKGPSKLLFSSLHSKRNYSPVQECQQEWLQTRAVGRRGEKILCLASQPSPSRIFFTFEDFFCTNIICHRFLPAGPVSGQVLEGDQAPSCCHVSHLDPKIYTFFQQIISGSKNLYFFQQIIPGSKNLKKISADNFVTSIAPVPFSLVYNSGAPLSENLAGWLQLVAHQKFYDSCCICLTRKLVAFGCWFSH